jgi:hypothetical protein
MVASSGESSMNLTVRHRSEGLFAQVPRRGQAVEKVVVEPVGGPKEAQNKAKTLHKGRFQTLNRELKRAHRTFSTRW